jgi:hypothetical protein
MMDDALGTENRRPQATVVGAHLPEHISIAGGAQGLRGVYASFRWVVVLSSAIVAALCVPWLQTHDIPVAPIAIVGVIVLTSPDLRIPHRLVAKLVSLETGGRPITESPYERPGAQADTVRDLDAASELRCAAEVQRRLLPQSRLSTADIQIEGACRPARVVGGDAFDYFKTRAGDVAFVITDVSGKGAPAALLMACVHAAVRSHANSGPEDVAAKVVEINQTIFALSPAERYATLFYAEYNPHSRRMSYVNAGHCAPMLLHDDQITRLSEGGSVIGLFPNSEFTAGVVEVCPGDVLIAFTDGISEAMNANDEFYGEDRIAATACLFRDTEVSKLVESIMAAAETFASDGARYDDMTVVALRVV